MHEIDLSRVDLNLLVVFDALMRERHVGRAGKRVHLTQPAVSHALGRLRHLLGDPLFLKHPKGMAPTPRAQALAAPLAAVLDGLRAALGEGAAFQPEALRRTITLGATDYVSFVLLPPLLRALRRRAPGIDLRVRSVDRGTVLQELQRGEIDLALGAAEGASAAVEIVPLFTERLVCIARRGHPVLAADAAGFAGYPHVLVSPRSDPHGLIDDALRREGLERRVVLTVPHFLAVPFIVAATDMVAALAERVALRLAATARVGVGPLPVTVAPWTVGLARLAAAPPDAGLQWFQTLVATVAAEV
jgi:DNA-binding transcriptional LysR family regulator